MLYERGYEKQDIIDLYCFIDWLLVLPEDLEEEFIRELCEYEKEKTMQYVSSIERIGFKKVSSKVCNMVCSKACSKVCSKENQQCCFGRWKESSAKSAKK